MATKDRSDPVSRAAEKRAFLEAALERGRAQIRLDARRAGVRVPEHLVAAPDLALNISWRFAHADMVINEHGLAATLRFGGVPFRCRIPWSALWGIAALADEAIRDWPADRPPELGGPPLPVDEPLPPPVEPDRPRLAALQGGIATDLPVAEESAPPPLAPIEPATPPAPVAPVGERAPWLRVVK